ncbi:hypothetical protein ACFVHW_15535 [Streptomyces sp. NPDC127110]|uniref:hypothetical protein n=1 Tax=Streptomyces sp. NPDC127110 TaxID=3345362 RepID=UPI003626F81A
MNGQDDTTRQTYDRLFDPLRAVSVWDVQIPGFVDRDSRVPLFTPWGNTVYLALQEGGYLRMDSVGGLGNLALRMVDEVEPPEDPADAEDEFALSSCGAHFLGDDTLTQRITGIRYVLSGPADLEFGTVRCIEFQFQYEQRLFVDPSYHWGIRLQGAGAFERWIQETRERPESSGPPREYGWTA